jgi:hypothetical protein
VSDDLRERLDQLPTNELEEILRDHDTEEWRAEVFPLVEAILQARGVDTTAVKALGPLPKEALEFVPVKVATSLGTLVEANLCRMALVEAGIEAWLSTEHLSGVAPPLGFAIGVDVLVRPENVAAARSVLASLEAGAAALRYEPEPCPGCGSLETEHRREGADRITALSDWATVGVPLPGGVWRWKCNACGREWE